MVVLRYFIGGAIRFVAYCQPKFRPEEHPANGLYNTFMHIPLLTISLYCAILSYRLPLQERKQKAD